MKAEKINVYYEKDSKGYTDKIIVYKYRGYKYEITIKGNGYFETLRTQHAFEQKRIDNIIDSKNKEHDTTNKFDIDEVFKILEWD